MDKIALSEMLTQLRKDLLKTQQEGGGSDLKFQIEDIEIELQLATTKGDVAGAGVKFWVFNADAKIDTSEAKTQKLKLKLKPVGPDGDQPVKIHSKKTVKPR
jgi:hypothetical protein